MRHNTVRFADEKRNVCQTQHTFDAVHRLYFLRQRVEAGEEIITRRVAFAGYDVEQRLCLGECIGEMFIILNYIRIVGEEVSRPMVCFYPCCPEAEEERSDNAERENRPRMSKNPV